MRVNDKDLCTAAMGQSCKEGRLNHKHTGFREGYKERWFKLKGNLLFYFRLNSYGGVYEDEPAGVLVMENYTVQEEMFSDVPFSFSIVFFDDLDKKHYFSCPTQKHCEEWVQCLKEASYEHQRVKLHLLQARIARLTGKDPLQPFPHLQHQHLSNMPNFTPPMSRPRSLPKTNSVPQDLPLLT